MKAQLVNLLYALGDHRNQIVIAYFCLAALSWQYWRKICPIFMSAVLIRTAVLLAVLTISAYIFVLAFYLLYPNYFDHSQPVVASISWLWMQGHELYPNWTIGDVYSSVYGPLIFLINGLALLLSPSIFASKLPGVLALGAALAATSILLKRTTGSILTSILLLGSLVLLFERFGVSAYWNRPEPFLILVSVLALLIASRPPSLVAGVGIGVLAGVAAGLKLTGFIYLAPAAAAFLARLETLHNRLVVAIIGSLCAAASALLPYLERGVSIDGYLRFLRVVLHQGWSEFLFVQTLLFVFSISTLMIVIWIWRPPALNPSDRWLLVALGLSAATVTMIAGKTGAGSTHLLPLVPISIYGIAVIICAASKVVAKEIAALIFVSFFCAYAPNVLLDMWWSKYLYQVAAPSEREKITELKTYLDSYPEAQIGVSDREHYSSYFYRVLSVWDGRPLHVDFSVWMDLAYIGVDEENIMRFIKECALPTWILPLGTPFTHPNFYGGLPLFSESFRQTFLANYRQIEIGQAFQVWRCNTKLSPHY